MDALRIKIEHSKIAGVVILYNPVITNVLENIATYLSFVNILYVLDNSENVEVCNKNQKELKFLGEKIVYISNKGNLGIGYSLNKAAELSIGIGYHWLLTMDQDSWFKDDQLELFAIRFFNLVNNHKSAAVVSPSYVKQENEKPNGLVYQEMNAVITSGSLICLSLWKELGGFNNALFIDEVDHEYCYRANLDGYKIILITDVSFEHELGVPIKAGYFGFFAKKERKIHPPLRVYYILRNYLYIRKRYRMAFRDEFKKRDKETLTTLKNNLFFGNSFWKTSFMILKASFDYIFKREKIF